MSQADDTIDQITRSQQILGDMSARQQIIYQEQIDIGKGMETTAEKKQADDELVLRTKMAAELRNQANNQAAAAAFGVNMDAPNQVVTVLGQKAMEALGRVGALTDKLSADRSKILTEDPVGYLYASATIPDTANQLNGALTQFQNITQMMNALNNTVQNQVQTNNATKATLSAESAEAVVKSASAEYQLRAAQMKRENLKYGLDSVTAAMTANKAQLDTAMQIYGVRNSEKHLELSYANFNLSRARFALDMEKKLKDQKEEINLVTTLNAGRARLNLPPVDSVKALQLMRMPGELGDTFRKQYELGARIDVEGSARFGSDPAEAALLINASNATLPAEQKRVQTFIEGVINKLRMDPANKNLKKEEFQAKVQGEIFGRKEDKKIVPGRLFSQASNIAPGDESNIYQAPSFETLIEQQEVKNSAFGKLILQPLAVNGIKSINPDDMVSKAAMSVKNKLVTVEQAAEGVATYYKAAARVNTANRRYEDFALPPQNTFNTTVRAPNAMDFTSTSIVNLTDETAVKRLMVQKLFGLEVPETGVFLPNTRRLGAQ